MKRAGQKHTETEDIGLSSAEVQDWRNQNPIFVTHDNIQTGLIRVKIRLEFYFLKGWMRVNFFVDNVDEIFIEEIINHCLQLFDHSRPLRTQENINLTSLIQLNFPTYAPDELPPELAASEAVKPGSRK